MALLLLPLVVGMFVDGLVSDTVAGVIPGIPPAAMTLTRIRCTSPIVHFLLGPALMSVATTPRPSGLAQTIHQLADAQTFELAKGTVKIRMNEVRKTKALKTVVPVFDHLTARVPGHPCRIIRLAVEGNVVDRSLKGVVRVH
ncbi:unnamed protein product [Ectocarpus fasciculatus]